MQFFNYFLLSIASFSGILLGIILAKIAPEEQKPLMKYFIASKRIILVLMFAFLIFFYIFDRLSLFLSILLLFPALFVEFRSEDSARKLSELFALLGIIFFLSSPNTNLLAIISSLTFLYGALFSGMIYSKNSIMALASGSMFLLVSSALFLFNYHFSFLI